MNSQKVISEAWKITLNRKHLWLFGFIAALTYGSEDIGVSVTQGGAWLFQNFGNILGTQGITTVIGIAISILLWLLGLLARIALIQDISVGEKSQRLVERVKNLFQVSLPSFGAIFVMQLVVWAPIIIANSVIFIETRPFAESLTSNITPGQAPTLDFFSAGVVGLMGVSVFLLTIPLLFIDAFSYRSIVIERLGVMAGVKRAWSLIRENVKPILGLAVLCMLIGIAFSFAVSLFLSPLTFAILPLMGQFVFECAGDKGDIGAMAECMQSLNLQPLFVGLTLFLGVLSAAVSSVWVAFQSTAFTLAYVRLAQSRQPSE